MTLSWLSVRDFWTIPLEVASGLQYVSRRYADGANSVSLAPYVLVDAMVAYTRRRYRIAANVRNIFDRIYAPWSDINYPAQVLLGPPRTFELSFRMSL